MALHRRPASSDQASVTTRCRLRQRICSRVAECTRIVGWIASKALRVVERPALRPLRGCAPDAEPGALHVDNPARVLRARPREQRPVRQLDRLGADRAQDPVGQPHGFRPRAPVVGRGAHETPPLAGARADLVEEEQRPARGLEQHRVPAGESRAVRLTPVGDSLGREPARCRRGAPSRSRRRRGPPRCRRTTPRAVLRASRRSSTRGRTAKGARSNTKPEDTMAEGTAGGDVAGSACARTRAREHGNASTQGSQAHRLTHVKSRITPSASKKTKYSMSPAWYTRSSG